MVRTICVVLAALIVMPLGPAAVRGQQLTWDPTNNPTAPVGGTGAWDTTSPIWSNGVTDFVWPGGATLAVFGGTAGTVTIAPGGVSAGGLTFTATGYAVGGDTLTLIGAGVVTIAAPLAGTTSAQIVLTDSIGSAIGGSVGLTKAGIGTLVLTGANPYTGPTTVAGGTLTLDFNATGMATPILNPANGLVFGGANGPAGTFSVNGATAGSSQSVSGVTLTSGSATISATSNTGTVTLSLGSISRSPGTALRFIVPAAGSITITTANANPTGGQQTILGGYAVVSGGTVSTWAVSGSGSTAGAISGLTTYNPVNTFTAGADIDVTAATTSAATLTINSLRLSSTTGGAALLTLSNPLTVATGGVLLANAASANSAITGSTITSGSGELIFNNYSRIDGTSRELFVASKVTGAINVTINGAGANGTGGQVELQNSNNDFVGTITVIGGRLGNGANVVTGGSAAFLGLGNATNPVVVVGNAAGGGEWFMNGAQNQSRPITISGVGWAESGGSFGAFRPRNTISGQITLAGNARIGVNNTGVVLSGKITGPYELSLDGNTTNPITISGTVNNYSGGTRIERGTAIMGATNALPTNTLLTFGTTYSATDTLRPEGLGTTTNAPTLNINGFATQVGGLAIEAGDAPAVANATITNTGAAATFTVNNAANSTFGGVITNTTNALSLAKSGIGTLTLSGANTYTGTTTVNGGTLALVSALSNSNVGSSTAIAVVPGATLDVTGVTGGFALAGSQTLTNNGTVAGAVTVPTGTTGTGTGAYAGDVTITGGTFTPGTVTTIGTIQSIGGNLAVNGGTFKIKVGGAASDQIASLTGSASFASNSVLSVAQLGAPASASYTILTAPGGITGLTAAPLATIGRTTYSIDGPALASNTLKLDVTGGPANMRWVGGDTAHNPTRWENTQLDANWTTADAVVDTTHFYDGDFVTFNNANNGNFTVNVTGTVSPGSISVSNGGGTTYTFVDGGAGQIAGNTGLTVSSDGTGTLVIGTHNTFSGPVSITGGTVSVSSSDNLGNAAATNTVALAGGTLRAHRNPRPGGDPRGRAGHRRRHFRRANGWQHPHHLRRCERRRRERRADQDGRRDAGALGLEHLQRSDDDFRRYPQGHQLGLARRAPWRDRHCQPGRYPRPRRRGRG
jgi:fibronectin-binding autotransporter adhesin